MKFDKKYMLKSEDLSLDSSNIKILSNGFTRKVMEIECPTTSICKSC